MWIIGVIMIIVAIIIGVKDGDRNAQGCLAGILFIAVILIIGGIYFSITGEL